MGKIRANRVKERALNDKLHEFLTKEGFIVWNIDVSTSPSGRMYVHAQLQERAQ